MDKLAEKALLRKKLRQQRSQLDVHFCKAAAKQIAVYLIQLPLFQTAQSIAYYWPMQNEMDPRPLIQKLNSSIHYLPVLNNQNKILQFYPYQEGEELQPNKLNIPEPITHNKSPISAEELDIILVPLLGFDLHGNRLGMGGGYYDHSFAFLKTHQKIKPCLIGLAYEFQKINQIPTENWDINLNYVATELNLYSLS